MIGKHIAKVSPIAGHQDMLASDGEGRNHQVCIVFPLAMPLPEAFHHNRTRGVEYDDTVGIGRASAACPATVGAPGVPQDDKDKDLRDIVARVFSRLAPFQHEKIIQGLQEAYKNARERAEKDPPRPQDYHIYPYSRTDEH